MLQPKEEAVLQFLQSNFRRPWLATPTDFRYDLEVLLLIVEIDESQRQPEMAWMESNETSGRM